MHAPTPLPQKTRGARACFALPFGLISARQTLKKPKNRGFDMVLGGGRFGKLPLRGFFGQKTGLAFFAIFLASALAQAEPCFSERRAWEMDKNDANLTETLRKCEVDAEAARVRLEAEIAAEQLRLTKLPTPRIGMTMRQVEASRWGLPDSINATEDANGVREQWVYGRNYVYFTRGRVSAIQTSR